jgi:hypothetical protein
MRDNKRTYMETSYNPTSQDLEVGWLKEGGSISSTAPRFRVAKVYGIAGSHPPLEHVKIEGQTQSAK